jgi:hypothetical protein
MYSALLLIWFTLPVLVVRLQKLITKFTTAILRQCTNVWLFFQKIGPPYHNTSVYRCMAIFLWKNGSNVPYFVGVPAYGYFLEKHGSTVPYYVVLLWLFFGKKYFHSTILRRMAIFWKKWVQCTIIRECTNEWLFYVSVQTYGYFLEKNCPLYSEVPHYIGVPVYGYFWEKMGSTYNTTWVYRRMAILHQCTNVWLFFGKKIVYSTPKYHTTSVYRCTAFFLKKLLYQKRGKMVRCRIRKKWLDVIYTKTEEK